MTGQSLATTILIFALFSCKKHDLGKYEFNYSADLPNQSVPIFSTSQETSVSENVENAILQQSEKSQYNKRVFAENSKLKSARYFSADFNFEVHEMWNAISDEAVKRQLADIENENSFEDAGDQIEYLELLCVQDATENKVLDDLKITFLDGHLYYLITFEVGDIYDFESSFDGERSLGPAYTKTVVLKNNRYGYLKWWKVDDNKFEIFEYSVSDINGNIKKTRLEK